MTGSSGTGAAGGLRRIEGAIQRFSRVLVERPSLLFFAWSLWLALEYIGLGPLSYVPLADHGENNLPARLATALAWRDGGIGYWFPQALTGADRLAMGFQNKSDLLLFFLLPGWMAHGLILWIQRFVAGYFMFRLLADRFATGFLPAVFGGVFYSLYSQPAINQQWAGFSLYDGLALPALPLVLWALGRILNRGGMKGILFGALLGAGYSLVSHFFYTVFILPLVALWFLLVERRSRGTWPVLAAFLLGWVIVEAPLLWASAASAPFGHRKNWSVQHFLQGGGTALWLQAVDLAAALVRDNLPALVPAAAGLAVARGGDRRLPVLLAFAAACLAYVVCEMVFLGGLLYQAGFFPGFNFTRVYIVFPFLCTAAGVLGLARIPSALQARLSGMPAEPPAVTVRSLVCVVLIGWMAWQSLVIKSEALAGIAEGRNYANLYRHPALEDLQRLRTGQPPFRVATVAGRPSTGPLTGCLWAYGLETADGYLPLFSERYHRFWETVLAPLEAHDPAAVDGFRRRGSRAYLYLPTDGRSDGQGLRLESYEHLSLLSLANVRYIVSAVPLDDPGLHLRSRDLLERQVDWARRPRSDRFLGMILGCYPGSPLYVYENTAALPRFFLTGRVRVFAERDRLLAALASASVGELGTTAFVMRADFDSPLAGAVEVPGEAELRSLRPDRIELRVDARSASVLIVTGNYSPWWRVLVDGVPVRAFPVDHTFMGVALTGGEHDVVFTYEPPFALVAGLGR